ncbi:MAG TPA: hypothetical protein VK249_01210 [Anaerolineales bacterium]|nr:hypothetical protein [Anaerolineales bacterium]
MGRTLPSTTQIAFGLIAELKPFYGALRLTDQLILDKFFEDALQHRTAISNAANLLPMEVMPFAILLEEHKRNTHIHNELFQLIEELENKLNSPQREIASFPDASQSSSARNDIGI